MDGRTAGQWKKIDGRCAVWGVCGGELIKIWRQSWATCRLPKLRSSESLKSTGFSFFPFFFFWSTVIITPEQDRDTVGHNFWRKLPKVGAKWKIFLSETGTLPLQRGSPSGDPSLAIRGVAPHIPLITLPWHLSSFRPRIRRNTTMAHRETLTCNERPGNNGH